ncbi:hypothetical protein Taro_052633 [Colocasia esculenta]|uniref:Uncharacterized protein n=1 Tax=Colocasia esculenta TaxID=4460 RepID=A0A843XKT6_COLES|nr:hypothetical protein [Colocasia esculenta]
MLREAEESRLEKYNLLPIYIQKKFLEAHFKSLVDSYTSYYEQATKGAPPPIEKNFYRGEMPCLEPVELFSTTAPSSNDDSSDYHWWSHLLSDCGYRPDVSLSMKLPPECVRNQAWACWERHLINIIGHARPLEYIPLLETASTLHDVRVIMERVNDICKLDPNELVSTPPRQAAATPVLQIDGDRGHRARLDISTSPRDRRTAKGKAVDYCSSNEDEVNDGNANLIASDEHIPLLGDSSLPYKGECRSSSWAAVDLAAEVDDVEPPFNCSFSETVVTGCDDSASAYAEFRALAEQHPFTPVDVYIPRPDEEYPAMEPISTDGQPFCDQLFSWGMMDPYSTFSTNGAGLLGQTDHSPESSIPPIDGGSLDPPVADYFSAPQELCTKESNFVRPLIPEAEVIHHLRILTMDFLLNRVRAVVASEDPPPIEVVKRVLKEKTMLAFNSGHNMGFGFDLALDFGFGFAFGFGFGLAYLGAMVLKFGFGYACLGGLFAVVWNLDLNIAYLCGLLAMDLRLLSGYDLDFGFDIAYLCGLLAIVLESRLAEDAK